MKYTPKEREEMLKKAMGEENYNSAVNELMPFCGGMSEYYDIYKIPYEKSELITDLNNFELPTNL